MLLGEQLRYDLHWTATLSGGAGEFLPTETVFSDTPQMLYNRMFRPTVFQLSHHHFTPKKHKQDSLYSDCLQFLILLPCLCSLLSTLFLSLLLNTNGLTAVPLTWIFFETVHPLTFLRTGLIECVVHIRRSTGRPGWAESWDACVIS